MVARRPSGPRGEHAVVTSPVSPGPPLAADFPCFSGTAACFSGTAGTAAPGTSGGPQQHADNRRYLLEPGATNAFVASQMASIEAVNS